MGSIIFPGVACRCSPGQKFKELVKKKGASAVEGNVDINSRSTMANLPWFMAYLLLATQEGKVTTRRNPVDRAIELLQLITSLPKLNSCELPIREGKQHANNSPWYFI